MADERVTVNIKAMTQAFAQIAEAARRATKVFGGFNEYQNSLALMLDEQIKTGRRRRNTHLITLAMAIAWAYFIFGQQVSVWVTLVMALPVGWLILDALYWATRWDNYTNEAEETRALL